MTTQSNSKDFVVVGGVGVGVGVGGVCLAL